MKYVLMLLTLVMVSSCADISQQDCKKVDRVTVCQDKAERTARELRQERN